MRIKFQKLDQLYQDFDVRMTDAKKLEVFTRNNNLRMAVIRQPNREVFGNCRNYMTCDKCKIEITAGAIRYKARKYRNFDICDHCIEEVVAIREDTLPLPQTRECRVVRHSASIPHMGASKVEPIWAFAICLSRASL